MPRVLLLVAMIPLTGWGQGDADVHPYLNKEYYASVGLFLPDQNTFSFSDSDESFSAEIGWRFATNWQLRGQ